MRCDSSKWPRECCSVFVHGGEVAVRRVVALRLRDKALLLECVGQVAVGVGEVGLEFDGVTVGVDGEVHEALLVVDAGKVDVHHRMILAQIEGAQVGRHSPEHRRFSY